MDRKFFSDRWTQDTSWRPKHTQVPLEKWKARAAAIETEADDLRSLVQFHMLRRDMSYLEAVIRESATDLDAYIQHQIDEIRGK